MLKPASCVSFPGIASGDFADDSQDILPDFLGVVFHPAGLRINLPMLARGVVQNLPARVEENRLRGGGALVEGED